MRRALTWFLRGGGALLAAFACVLAALLSAQSLREADPQPPPAAERRLATREGVIAYEAFGPAQGRPVLIVGGTASWSEFWRPVAEGLAAEGYRAIALDLPPFGHSDFASDGDYSRKRQADRLAAFVEALDLRKPILLGHSYGGSPALELALSRPGLLGALVLVDPGLGLPPPGEAQAPDSPLLGAALATPGIARAFVALSFTNPFAMRGLLAGSFQKKEAATPAIAELLRAPQARPGAAAALAAWLPALLLPDHSGASADLAALARLDAPAVVIWGEDDPLTPMAQARQLKALLPPSAKFLVIAGVGHFPQVEDFAGFMAALLRGLRGLD